MTQRQGTFRNASKLKTIPLAVAYVAIPLGMVLARFQNPSAEVSPFLPWLILAGLGTVCAMLFRSSGVRVKKRFVFEVAMFITLITILVLYGRDIFRQMEPAIPYISEALPLGMLLFCGLWIKTFGMPDRADFQRYGALLGLLCIIDLAAEAVIYQSVPTVRWLGNADVLAGLLLVSLCASLKPGDNEGGVYEPDQGHRLWRLLVMLGIAACLSRTGLFAAAWVYLCFGRGPKKVRIAGSTVCLSLIGATFFLPVTSSDSIRYVDYWLWVETIRLFAENPMLLLTGLPVSQALPVAFPVGMAPVWEAATGSPAMMGAYLPLIPSFWLRLSLAWGIIAPLMLLTVLFVLLFRRLTRMGAGLTAALFAQGMNTPLLYDPAMAAAIGLGFFLVLARPLNAPNVRTKKADVIKEADPTPDPVPDPEPDPDPSKEWDMQPL